MVGLDLAKDVTSGQSYSWDETEWRWNEGYGHESSPRFHVVAIDYGLKRNILRELATRGLQAHGAAGDGDRGRGARAQA